VGIVYRLSEGLLSVHLRLNPAVELDAGGPGEVVGQKATFGTKAFRPPRSFRPGFVVLALRAGMIR